MSESTIIDSKLEFYKVRLATITPLPTVFNTSQNSSDDEEIFPDYPFAIFTMRSAASAGLTPEMRMA